MKLGKLETSTTFPALSIADGPGLKIAKVGHIATFKVYAKDRFGEDVITGKFKSKNISMSTIGKFTTTFNK